MRIGAGQMDRRITLRRATYTQDAVGESIATWATLASVAAQFIPVSDGDMLRGDEVSADMLSRFRIRWSRVTSSVDPKDRLIFETREYQIHGVKEIGRRDFLEITASARAET